MFHSEDLSSWRASFPVFLKSSCNDKLLIKEEKKPVDQE
jgi:hypothetical protein